MWMCDGSAYEEYDASSMNRSAGFVALVWVG
jgi:hypothetical protein